MSSHKLSNTTEDWIVNFGTMVLLVPCYSYVLLKTHHRRHLQPIKSRRPYVTLGLGLSITMFLFWSNIGTFWDLGPHHEFKEYFLNYCIGMAFTLRCWDYYFKHKLISEKIEYMMIKHEVKQLTMSMDWLDKPKKNDDETKSSKIKKGWAKSTNILEKGWYIHHQHLVSYKYFIIYSIIVGILLAVPELIVRFTAKDLKKAHEGILRTFLLIEATFFIIIYITYGISMRKAPSDGFGIKREFGVLGKLIPVLTIVWFGFGIVFEDFNKNTWRGTIFFSNLLYGMLFYMSIFVPLLKSYSVKALELHSAEGERLSFKDVIKSKHGFLQFRNFLAREFSFENLYFMGVLNDMKRAYPEEIKGQDGFAIVELGAQDEFLEKETYQENMKWIFDKFVKSSGELKINIPWHEQKILEAEYEKYNGTPPLDIFRSAEKTVYILMKKDSFSRFTRSKEGKALESINTELHVKVQDGHLDDKDTNTATIVKSLTIGREERKKTIIELEEKEEIRQSRSDPNQMVTRL